MCLTLFISLICYDFFYESVKLLKWFFITLSNYIFQIFINFKNDKSLRLNVLRVMPCLMDAKTLKPGNDHSNDDDLKYH